MTKRGFMGDTPEYGTIESSNQPCSNWGISSYMGLVCKGGIDWSVPEARQPRLGSQQCKAHTTFWVTFLALIPMWLLSYRSYDVRLPHFLAIYLDSDDPTIQRELAFLTVMENARKKGSLIKNAQFLQFLFLGLHLYLHDALCEVGVRRRFNTILSYYTESEVAFYTSLPLVAIRILSDVWKLLRLYIRPWLRFYVKILGKRWHFIRKPEAVGLAVQEIAFLAAYPVLGFLLTWPDEGALALGGGKWSLAQVLFIFSISWYQETRNIDFAEDEVELVDKCYNPDIGYCSICGNLDEDFEDRLSDWFSRSPNVNAEAGLDSTPLLKQWLCLQCEGSDGLGVGYMRRLVRAQPPRWRSPCLLERRGGLGKYDRQPTGRRLPRTQARLIDSNHLLLFRYRSPKNSSTSAIYLPSLHLFERSMSPLSLAYINALFLTHNLFHIHRIHSHSRDGFRPQFPGSHPYSYSCVLLLRKRSPKRRGPWHRLRIHSCSLTTAPVTLRRPTVTGPPLWSRRSGGRVRS